MRTPDPSVPRGAPTPPAPATVSPAAQPARSPVDTSRPSGAHLVDRMQRGLPLIGRDQDHWYTGGDVDHLGFSSYQNGVR